MLARRQPPQWFWYFAGATTLGFGGALLVSYLFPPRGDADPSEAVVLPAQAGTAPPGTSAARERLVAWARAQVARGAKVRWAAKGPNEFDCSGLVTAGIYATTGRDLRKSTNAQGLFDATPQVAVPSVGDLGFLGTGPRDIYHVVLSLGNGWYISADGASNTAAAKLLGGVDPAAYVARTNRVKTHPNSYRSREFVAWHSNTLV